MTDIKFDFYNPDTWENIPFGTLSVEGVTVYSPRDYQPLQVTEFCSMMKAAFDFLEKSGRKLTQEEKADAIETMAKRLKENCSDVEKMKVAAVKSKIENERMTNELNNDNMGMERIKPSNKIYGGFNFTQAELLFIKNLSDAEKERFGNFLVSAKEKRLHKSKLRQEIFDSHFNINNYLFSDLFYAEFVEEENTIMEEFFCSFDSLQDVWDFEDGYLEENPSVKKNVIEHFQWLNSL